MKKVMSVYLKGNSVAPCCGGGSSSSRIQDEITLPSGKNIRTRYGTTKEVDEKDFNYLMSFNEPVEIFKEVK